MGKCKTGSSVLYGNGDWRGCVKVIDTIIGADTFMDPWEQKQAQHKAEGYFIEDSKL